MVRNGTLLEQMLSGGAHTEEPSNSSTSWLSGVTDHRDNTSSSSSWLPGSTTWVNKTSGFTDGSGVATSSILTAVTSYTTDIPSETSPMMPTVISTMMTTASSIADEVYTGDDRPLLIHGSAGPDSHNMAPLGLLAVIVITVIGNATLCLAVKMDRHLHHMTYYFLVSMGILNMMMSAVVMPPAILLILTGEFTYSEEVCKLWITIDLFFCNNTCLHLAFSNMDMFLRLKDPLRHGRLVTTCSLILWLGAPWCISFVQGIAQFMLSQADHGIIQNGVCFIADKNFVILGTLFSFFIPSVIAVAFYVLCVHEIKALKQGKFLDESDGSGHHTYNYGSNESLADDGSDTTSCVSDTTEQVHIPREEVQLAVVTNIKEGEVKECVGVNNGQVQTDSHIEQDTSFCTDAEAQKVDNNAHDVGHTNIAFTEHLLSTDQSTSCTLLLRDPATDPVSVNVIRANAEEDHSSPDEALRHEMAISRLMFMLLLTCITLWVPFSISNVVYGICFNCRRNMTFDEMMTFKWLAYCCTMVGPFIYGKFSEPLRDAYVNIITCRYCRY